jgi:hypothetical protein
MVTNGSTSRPTTITTEDLLGDKIDPVPSNTTLIIALAAGIPAALIVIVGIGIWLKKTATGGLLSSISRPFNNIARSNGKNDVELDDIDADDTF